VKIALFECISDCLEGESIGEGAVNEIGGLGSIVKLSVIIW
jgi:hypothetical protein